MNVREIGRAVRKRRRSLGVDQKSLSELAGVSVHTLSDVESGKGNPTVAVMNMIARPLGMDVVVEVRNEPQR